MHSVLANARELTGMMKSVVVGMSRATQVGMIDSTMVGHTHSVMVSPPGEDGPSQATSFVMVDNKIASAVPGGASITIEDDAITFDTGHGAVLQLKADTLVIKATNVLIQSLGDTHLSSDQMTQIDAKYGFQLATENGDVDLMCKGDKSLRLLSDGKAYVQSADEMFIDGAKVHINR